MSSMNTVLFETQLLVFLKPFSSFTLALPRLETFLAHNATLPPAEI